MENETGAGWDRFRSPLDRNYHYGADTIPLSRTDVSFVVLCVVSLIILLCGFKNQLFL